MVWARSAFLLWHRVDGWTQWLKPERTASRTSWARGSFERGRLLTSSQARSPGEERVSQDGGQGVERGASDPALTSELYPSFPAGCKGCVFTLLLLRTFWDLQKAWNVYSYSWTGQQVWTLGDPWWRNRRSLRELGAFPGPTL